MNDTEIRAVIASALDEVAPGSDLEAIDADEDFVGGRFRAGQVHDRENVRGTE